MSDSLGEIAKSLRIFADQRDWGQFHSVRNLVLALVGEVGEVAELIQWKSDQEVTAWLGNDEGKSQLGGELADILMYVVRLGDIAGLDLRAEVGRKIQLNAERYPVEKSFGNATKHTGLR